MPDFAQCSGRYATLTAAQICEGFSKCGPDGIRMNANGLNAVVRVFG